MNGKRWAATILLLLLASLTFIPVAAQEIIECEPGFRLFTHELLWTGTPDGVCIPEDPQRIAYAWVFHIPAMLRNNYPFVGIGSHEYVAYEFPEWLPAVEGLADYGLPPNLEVVLESNPDLIIEPSWLAEENYADISAIAPTVAFQFDFTHHWKQLTEMYFDLAGMPEAYDTLIAEYEARAAELGALIGNPEDIEVSLIWVDMTNLNMDPDYSVGGTILADVGFSRPESQILPQTPEEMLAAGIDPFYLPISWERAQDADGDFIIAYGEFRLEEGESRLADLQANPLWQALNAVQNGNVYYTSVNWAGGDIAGAHFILDDIARAFGVFEQLSSNPYVIAQPEATPEATAMPE